MITEDYCSFELSILLKEKGFDLHDTKELYIAYKDGYCVINKHYPTDEFPKATHQMALKWLRETHHLHADISIGSDSSTDADGNIIEEWYYWAYSIRYTIDGHIIYDNDSLLGTEYQSYEEAVESAIKYCLTNLIK